MADSPKLQKGINAARKGDMKRAAEMFQAVLKADPKNPEALYLAGTVHHLLGKSDQAIRLIQRSLAINDENPQAHSNLGNVYKQLGRDADAVASYRKALEYDPINVECLNNFAVVLRNAGHFERSTATLKQAIALAPGMPELHHNLGATCAAAGSLAKAADHFRDELKLAGEWSDPISIAQIFNACGKMDEAEDLLVDYLARHPKNGAVQFQLSALRGEDVDRASESYVTEVFDRFAASFDAALERIEYCAPRLVGEAVAAQLGAPKADQVMLDLGCGTGLCGPEIKVFKSSLTGVDLSPEMMRRAESRGCYDVLEKAELQQYLETQPPGGVDVTVCADTLIYLGALERTFAGIHRVLRPGGLFVASVEALGEGAARDYSVDGTGRFQHKRSYLEALAAANGLDVLAIDRAVIRKEFNGDVEGLMVSVRSPA